MPRITILLLNFLTIHIILALAGNCFSAPRDPDDKPPLSVIWSECKNRPAEGQTWACEDPSLSFPTVECLAADMKTCGGNIGLNTVFYSFGAATSQARKSRDTLTPKGVMFNDVLEESYGKSLKRYELGFPKRQAVYVARYAEAMARLSTGKAYVVVKNRISRGGGGEGAYQNPLADNIINTWRNYEFPTLQRNSEISSVTSVDLGNNYQQTVDWSPEDGNEILPASNAGSLPIPEVPPCVANMKRDASTCIVPTQCSLHATAPSSISTFFPSTSAVGSTITAAPTPLPSCELHSEYPDQGINQAFCLCDKSITLTPLPATSEQSESCAYKSIPTATAAMETVTTQTQVWTSNCAACTIVGGIADAATCTTVAGCTPTAAPSPTIAAWVGNLSTIEIGNADDGNGGKDLAAEMFGKLKAMCSGSTCKGDHAEMDNVEAVIADGEEPLKPAMYLQDTAFSSQAILEKMLAVGISSWVSSLNDPTINLCNNVTYEADADETGSGCGEGLIPTSRLRRRVKSDDGTVLWERGGLAVEKSGLAERCSDNCGAPLVCHYEARMCTAPNEITVVMDGDGDPYANHLNIGVTLDKSGNGFLCEEITEGLTAAVAILAPQLLEEDALAEIELEAICGIINDPASAIGNLKEVSKISRRATFQAPKAVPASATDIVKIN